jgi:hypothetical protein
MIGPTKEYEARQKRAMGCSLRDISKELGIPLTSVKRLVEDIKLSEQQKKDLLSKKKNYRINIDYKDSEIKIKGKINANYSAKLNSSKAYKIIETHIQNIMRTLCPHK